MFSGIVEAVGEVVRSEDEDGSRRFRIRVAGDFLSELGPGSSVSVDGACLTLTEVADREFVAQAIGTTLSRTVAAHYREGTYVNLERALRMGGRVDGHLVQGHVDGVGHLMQITNDGSFHLLEVAIPSEVHRLTVDHGSICLNGVSLTVNRLLPDHRIEVGIVPHTWSHTNLGKLTVGDPVNVEGDLIGKYVGTLVRSGSETGDDAGGTHGA